MVGPNGAVVVTPGWYETFTVTGRRGPAMPWVILFVSSRPASNGLDRNDTNRYLTACRAPCRIDVRCPHV